jgi:hypothetical protein
MTGNRSRGNEGGRGPGRSFGHRMERGLGRGIARAIPVIALSTVLLAALSIPAGAENDVVSRKMLRQLGVMEKIIDQVLIDSPNFLVSGGDNTRGLYLEEFGVLLSFEASLVNKGSWDIGRWGGFQIEEDKEGRKVIVIPGLSDDEDKDKDKDTGKGEPEEENSEGSDRLSWRDRFKGDESKLYDRGKDEIRGVLLDYGDTVSQLRDDQWLAIAAFLKDSDYFLENKISRLVIKAKMSDLRAYAAGKISEKEMIGKLVEEEY